MSITSLLNRFKRKPKPAPQVQIVRVEPQKMTLTQWRANEALVLSSQMLATNDVFKAHLDILNNEHPARLMFPKTRTSHEDRVAHQAQIEGYELCLSNLRLMARYHAPKKELGEPTFEQPQEDKK